jgi:subtilisin-like proprotein convertase family protein
MSFRFGIIITVATMLLMKQINLTCIPIKSTLDPSLKLPPEDDTEGTVTTSIMSELSGYITSVKVIEITGSHPYLGDLHFSLISPDNTTIDLFNFGECGHEETDDFSFKFDDDGETEYTCQVNDGSYYKPNGQLSSLINENSYGTWTLIIEDDDPADNGFLYSWGLEICSEISKSSNIIKKVIIKDASSSSKYDSELGSYFLYKIVNFSSIEMPTTEGNLEIDQETIYSYILYNDDVLIDETFKNRNRYNTFIIQPDKLNARRKSYVAWDVSLDPSYCDCSSPDADKVGNGITSAFVKFFNRDYEAVKFYLLLTTKYEDLNAILKIQKDYHIEIFGSSDFSSNKEIEDKFYLDFLAKDRCVDFCLSLE